jgi:hypothetical protein
MQPAKLVNKSIAPRFAAIIITLAPLTSCGEWTGACEAGCLCFRDRNSCEANGCSWNGSYCPNGPFGDDGGIADARDVGDAGAVDAGVSCGGTIACSIAQPTCPNGQVPTIADGWTGACEAIATCDVPPPCADINDQADCLARGDCSAVYTGIDCTVPDGSTCQAGDTECTCASYVFTSCDSKS